MNYSKLLICPGAQKAGTTWLFRVLKKHPDFWMPPQKELDYLFHFRPSRQKYSRKMGAKLQEAKPTNQTRKWMRAFIREWRLEKYPSLFEPAGDRFAGDVSPNYSRMSAEEIARAGNLVRGARIVILLRDPVPRAWSHARNTAKTWGVDDQEVLIGRMSRFVSSRICDLMSDYPRLITDWSNSFGADRVLACFYDELERDPATFIDRILAFMGAPNYPEDRLNELETRPNVGASIAIPEPVRELLTDRYAPMLQRLRNIVSLTNAPVWLGAESSVER